MDTSYARQGDQWVVAEYPTPGHPNTMEAFSEMHGSLVEGAKGLVINELMASNHTTIADEDGDYPDWTRVSR